MKMRFAVQMLYFDCEPFILKAIENCAPFVEKIYISYSKLPWTYNVSAREQYLNNVNRDLIYQSKFVEKIELIECVWDTEEDQRNDCLKKAKSDGIDFLIIQDADEFYTPDAFLSNLKEIESNPNFLYYRNPWHLFWKNIEHVIVFDEVHGIKDTNVNYSACFAVNCSRDVWFRKNRLVTTSDAMFLSGVCCHLSYVMTDQQMYRKIHTWGHSHQVASKELWYKVKWLGWNENTRNIGLINPISWVRAERFNGELPQEVQTLKILNNDSYVEPLFMDKIVYGFFIIMARFRKAMRSYKRLFSG